MNSQKLQKLFKTFDQSLVNDWKTALHHTPDLYSAIEVKGMFHTNYMTVTGMYTYRDNLILILFEPIDKIYDTFYWQTFEDLYINFEVCEGASTEDIHYLPIWRYLDKNKYMAYL